MARARARRRLARWSHRAGRARSFHHPSTRAAGWRVADGGRAPRLGSRQYIGHDVGGRGAWAGRDPLATPRWWPVARWAGLLGWAGLTAGAGYLSWRRHGGREGLFGPDEGRVGG